MTRAARRAETGVTLIEMVIVVAIIGLLAAVMFPSVSSGIDALRLQQAADGIASFVNSGMNRAERRQEAVEITIAKAANELAMHSTDAGFEKRLEMPDGIRIVDVLPEAPEADANGPRNFLVYPGGSPPRFGVVLLNRRGDRRVVRLDPITGVSRVER